VLRIRAAFTGIAAQGEHLKPYQFIPIAFVATMAARTVTGTPQRAFIVVEVEGTDSVTGELLGERERVGTGQRLARVGDQQIITLDTVKPLLDELADSAFPELAQYVKPK
jgi:poly(3-hydroxybutyrate) depolymerase